MCDDLLKINFSLCSRDQSIVAIKISSSKFEQKTTRKTSRVNQQKNCKHFWQLTGIMRSILYIVIRIHFISLPVQHLKYTL